MKPESDNPERGEQMWKDVPPEHWQDWQRVFEESHEILNLSSPCPVCGVTALHRYYWAGQPLERKIRDNTYIARGGLWQWCANCRSFAHYSAFVPDWWSCDLQVNTNELTPYPTAIEKAIRLHNLLQDIKDYWSVLGIKLNSGATQSLIKEFEMRYQIQMPFDLRTYFIEINGMQEYELDGLSRLYSLERVRPLTNYLTDETRFPSEFNSYFIFGDYNIEGSVWAIQLTKTEQPTNPVIVLYPYSRHVRQVASSFQEFIEQYVKQSPESLI